jgi:DNA-binding IscR family transcriptional regulator
VLSGPAQSIGIKSVLKVLGGALFSDDFCGNHAGALLLCTNSVDCSARSLWNIIQTTVDQLLDKITLHDLVNSEKDSADILSQLKEQKSLITEII